MEIWELRGALFPTGTVVPESGIGGVGIDDKAERVITTAKLTTIYDEELDNPLTPEFKDIGEMRAALEADLKR